MGNTTKRIPQTVKLELIARIEAMPESRDKQILADVFVHEMSCKQVADSMRYLSNRGTPISHRQVVNVVNAFYPDYSNASKGKGHARNRNKESQIAEAFKWELIAERGCKCEQCGKVGVKLELHHTIPIAFGGETNRENCLLLCLPCHKAETKKQQWGEHHKGWPERKERKDEAKKRDQHPDSV